MGIKKILEVLNQVYGDSYAWTEVDEVLNSEARSLGIGKDEIHDPFKNLIIGVLSQNTSDKNCTRAYIGLVKETKITPQAISRLSEDEIRDAIKTGGLYNLKAKRVKILAETIVKKYGGDASSLIVYDNPETTRERLLNLPGIGPKTADVFLNECVYYGTMAVDTNIDRVVKRLGIVPSESGYYEVKRILESKIPPEERQRAHELLIRLGRDYCKALKPLCRDCPLLDGLCEKYLA